MKNAVCSDGRIHGMLQFYGAMRSGRWAGRVVQLQNLPRNYLEDLDTAREVLKSRDVEMLDLLYGNPGDVIKQLIRTALVAEDGHRFIVADFSAIEPVLSPGLLTSSGVKMYSRKVATSTALPHQACSTYQSRSTGLTDT